MMGQEKYSETKTLTVFEPQLDEYAVHSIFVHM